jgi:hypothetical protein
MLEFGALAVFGDFSKDGFATESRFPRPPFSALGSSGLSSRLLGDSAAVSGPPAAISRTSRDEISLRRGAARDALGVRLYGVGVFMARCDVPT